MGAWFRAAVAISLTLWVSLLSYVVGWELIVYKKRLLSLQVGYRPYPYQNPVQRARVYRMFG